MHLRIKEYVDKINNGEIIKTIDLERLAIEDSDIQPLLEALKNNPEVAEKVQKLDLSNNHLTSIIIPSELIALQELVLRGNQLTSIIIPHELTALQSLNLGNNQLTSVTIPRTLIVLCVLSLTSNKLASITIPSTLKRLRYLDISYNQLTHVKISSKFSLLQYLDFSHNKLASIIIPRELTILVSLDLSDNELTSIIIPPELIVLQNLTLRNNNLTSVIIPTTLRKLKSLSIKGNSLSSMQCLMLYTLRHVTQSLDLSYHVYSNQIAYLTTGMVSNHFEPNRTFANKIISLKPTTLKILILQQLKDWVVADIAENTIEHVVPIIRELVSDHFQNLCAAAIDPDLELDAMRAAFATTARDVQIRAISANALTTLNEFSKNDFGKRLIDARKQEYKNFTKDKNAFMSKLHLALNIVRNGSHYILEIREGRMEAMVGAARSPSEAFYRTLQNILREYGIPNDLLPPKEVLEIIKPLQLSGASSRVRATTPTLPTESVSSTRVVNRCRSVS